MNSHLGNSVSPLNRQSGVVISTIAGPWIPLLPPVIMVTPLSSPSGVCTPSVPSQQNSLQENGKRLVSFSKHMCACSATQLYLTLCDPMDCSPPGSSVHGILQARILEWVAIPFSRGSSQPRGGTLIFCTSSQILYNLSH